MCSYPQNFLRGPKLENCFFQSWIFAKRFERFFIFFKNQKLTIFYPNLPPDTYGYWKKVIYHDDGHGKTKKCTSQIFDFWNFITHFFQRSEEPFSKCWNVWNDEKIRNLSKRFAEIHDWKKWFSNFRPRKKFRGFEPIIFHPQLFVGDSRKLF